jgi:hypothetical protein
MEIFESQDPEKKRLMDEAKKHQDNLTDEVRMISERTEKIITNAVIIGGALALTYVLVRQFSGGKSKKKKSRAIKIVAQAPNETAPAQEETEEENEGSSLLNQIGTKIANEATVFLLNLAKEKLSEYLQTKETSKSNHENH